MGKFVTHEALSLGYFNRNFTGGTGLLQAWSLELTNSPTSLDFLIQRLRTDYERLNPKMRRAYGAKDIVAWIQIKH